MAPHIQSLGGFTTCEPFDGLIFEADYNDLPSKLFGFVDSKSSTFGGEEDTVYGYALSGEITLNCASGVHRVSEGMYFSAPGLVTLDGDGKAVVFERSNFEGIFALGGPVESRGRLEYIDGCTTSILVFPQRQGDPVLNILWFPKHVRQTMHYHPTVRLAVVIGGRGVCDMPAGQIPLEAGKVFNLEPMARHCFHTTDEEMAIVTYHPDSDWGPTDTVHPMLKQTMTMEK